jgi:hypothetical protein
MSNTSTIHEYARMGAASRIAELQAEIAELHKIFPNLEGTATTPKGPAQSKALAKLMNPAPKRKRKLSAAARKAISDAQKRRWAALKAQK